MAVEKGEGFFSHLYQTTWLTVRIEPNVIAS